MVRDPWRGGESVRGCQRTNGLLMQRSRGQREEEKTQELLASLTPYFLTSLHRHFVLRPLPIVGGGADSHPAKFFLVILLVQDVPLLAAFEDFLFLLRSDALADF